MYYSKKISRGARVRSRVYVNDFSKGIVASQDKKHLPLSYAFRSYNTAFKGGALKGGFGIKKATFDGGVLADFTVEGVLPKKLYYYKRYDEEISAYLDCLLIYASDNNFYKMVLGIDEGFSLVSGLAFEKEPSAVTYNYNGKDVIIFSVGNLSKVYDGETVTSVEDAPGITSSCIHSERLFATEGGDKTTLWFSDDFNPLNWNVSLEDAGYIDLRDGRGSLLKVISFDGYLYVFRNYGISRITAYGDQAGFSVDGITASASRIIPESICVCSDRIIYLAEDGFYSFSGGTPTRIMGKLDGLNINAKKGARAHYYRGNYYCVLTLKDENGVEFQALICYLVKDGQFTVSKNLNVVDFTVMEAEKELKLLFICGDNSAIGELSEKSEYFSRGITKSWESGESDFGISKEKTLTKLFINSEAPVKVRVKSEIGSRTLSFMGSKKMQMIPVGLRGEYYSFLIECDTPECSVSYLGAEVEYDG